MEAIRYEVANVHRNLNKKCVSVRQHGKVVAHPASVVATDVEFRVQGGCVASLRSAGVRAVCAYAHAQSVQVLDAIPPELLARALTVHYNPFLHDTFVLEDGRPVHAAAMLIMTSPKGSWVIDPR